MIQGSRAGTTLRSALLSLTNPTGQTAEVMEDLGIELENTDGTMKSMPEIIGTLNEAMEGMTDTQRTQTTAQLVGQQAAAGFSALLEEGEGALTDYTAELSNSEGVAQDVAETQRDTVNGAFDEFQSALSELGISIGQEFLPTFRGIIDVATEVVGWLGELDTRAVALGLTTAGLASGLGVLITTVYRFRGAIRALYVSLGPAGWLIAGISAVAGVAVGATTAMDEFRGVNLETAESLNEQSGELRENAERFEDLQQEAFLTTDEFGKLLDIRKEMGETDDVERLDELQDKYDDLQEKSGLTNEELNELIGLNGDIIEQAPHTAEAHSEQGEAIAGVNDELEDYLNHLEDKTLADLEAEQAKWMEEEAQHMEDIAEAEEKREQHIREINAATEVQGENNDYLLRRRDEINDKLADYTTGTEETLELEAELLAVEAAIDDELNEHIGKKQEKRDEQQEIIDNAETELEKGEAIDDLIAQTLLRRLDINAEGEEGIAIAEEQLEENQKEIDQLEEQIDKEGDINGLNQGQIELLERQNGEIEGTLGLIGDKTDLQGESISEEERFNSQVDNVNANLSNQNSQHYDNKDAISENISEAYDLNSVMARTITKELIQQGYSLSDAQALSRELASSETKNVDVIIREQVRGTTRMDLITNNLHTGGIVGQDERPTLHDGGTGYDALEQMRNRTARHLENLPRYNEVDTRLLQNEMVLTEGQQANLFRAMDNAHLAGRGGSNGGGGDAAMSENNALLRQIVEELGESQSLQVLMDSREVGRLVEPHISHTQARKTYRQNMYKGRR